MNKNVRVILIDEAEKAYIQLNKIVGRQGNKNNSLEMQLLKSINQKKELIKQNPFYGDNVPKKFIPKVYKVNNLWRVELPGYWRMLYTIKGDEIEIICFVLEIIDHEKYNKLFKYKKK
jgi:hypothetical protein